MKQKVSFAKLLLYYALPVCGLLNLYKDYCPIGNQECFKSEVGHSFSLFWEDEGDAF